MAHKTFVSYKWSEARRLRDDIISALGDNATYYRGETSESPDLTDTSTENIKRVLRNMMYDTSVTIVIISPHMTESKWIDWEIEYCLKKTTRKGRTSQTNGIVGVIMKVNGGYDWFRHCGVNCHGVKTFSYDLGMVHSIIANNHFNSEPPQWHCCQCRAFDWLNGSYIAFVEEDEFLRNPVMFIDNAFDKSEDDGYGYDLCRHR